MLIVTRVDGLARSTQDLLNTLDTVARTGAGFKWLADAWAGTATPHGRLMLTVPSVADKLPGLFRASPARRGSSGK
jgi:DNA invertase Pin-like site-specific DNA recombinase